MLTDEQKKQRQGKITSSIAAAALGMHPRMTPIDAWRAVRGELPSVETKATDRGNRLEHLVLGYPAEKLDLAWRPGRFRQHPDLPWAGDSVDAMYWRNDKKIGDGDFSELAAIGEGKTAAGGMAKEFGEEGTDQIPTPALVQCHWHLIHWPEVDRCLVSVLIGGWDFEFRIYHVDRNTELEGALITDLEKWHRDYIIGNKPPPPMAGDTEFLTGKYQTASADLVEPTADLVKWACQAEIARQHKKIAEEKEAEAKNFIRSALGDHSGYKFPGGSVSWKNSKGTLVTDWEAVAKEAGAPESIIQKFTNLRPGPRVLRVTIKDKQE